MQNKDNNSPQQLIGFLKDKIKIEQIKIPDDFNIMEQEEIIELFEAKK
ncbi:MAG: hypothetical protein FWD28_07980 [Treponema sp.]|nr:hypothetical protein [Treponema sp.]